ncbi:nitronate monooxygenase [Ectothiorhodospiraceae bacterium WFHF3C12]|nr:nitronate monooxygenase [Ectothiorhodospiraceae bacterium WFHF3C12]
MKTKLTEMFDIATPILLAPMGYVAGGQLASAVSRAGGLGIVGAGYGNVDWLRNELDDQLTVDKFGIGFITWSLSKNPSVLDFALSYSPTAIMLSFGDPESFIPYIKQHGARVICQVQSVTDACKVAEQGADLIVAQGQEAGGHGGGRGTATLVPSIVDAVSPTPVVAAGGIGDHRGLVAAIMLGACGALVGTRFMATPEASLPELAKELLVRSSGDDTLRTRVFDIVRGYDWPEPFTGRALQNQFTKTWHGRERDLSEHLETVRERFWSAKSVNDYDIAELFCGEALDFIHSEDSAANIVAQLTRKAESLLLHGPLWAY